ncbi:MAG: NAD(P)-dependent oxidoreductase [Patescibacteria group bacterium]
MKIALFEVSSSEEKEYFQSQLKDHELFFFDEILDPENLPDQKDFEAISIFVNSKMDAAVIDSFPNLKMIATRTTGFDNVDSAAAKSKNIAVCNVPAYGSHTVAEFTFGLILSLMRKVYLGANRVKVASDFNLEGLRGEDLFQKTLGVIGTGKIGTNVIKIAQGFEMKVLAYDPKPKNELSNQLHFSYVPLEELLKNSDIVTLHVPLLPDTKHLINRQNILTMKKGSFLINTSRGPVLETEAIFQAITSGHLAGAALDVLEEEGETKEEIVEIYQRNMPPGEAKRILENHLLAGLPQVIITPHMAFYSKEAEHSIWQTTVANIKSVIEGNPENLVNG